MKDNPVLARPLRGESIEDTHPSIGVIRLNDFIALDIGEKVLDICDGNFVSQNVLSLHVP